MFHDTFIHHYDDIDMRNVIKKFSVKAKDDVSKEC